MLDFFVLYQPQKGCRMTDLLVVIQARIGGAPAASAGAGRRVPAGVPIRAQRRVESCVSCRFVDQILVKTHLDCMTKKPRLPRKWPCACAKVSSSAALVCHRKSPLRAPFHLPEAEAEAPLQNCAGPAARRGGRGGAAASAGAAGGGGAGATPCGREVRHLHCRSGPECG